MSEKFNSNGFSTVLPKGWIDRSVISLIDPNAGSGFATNVVVLREKVSPSTSVEEYAQQQIAQVQAQIPNSQVLDQRPTTIQRQPAYQALQRFVAEERVLQQAQTFVLSGDTIFAFTCTALIEEFDRSIPAFREIMDNLSFTQET